VLKEEKIPEHLCAEVKKRVDEELDSSAVLRNSGENEAGLKINIYNIILMIIQEVIKWKNKMKENLMPIFQSCREYQ
jgi:hypothetical protein